MNKLDENVFQLPVCKYHREQFEFLNKKKSQKIAKFKT